MKHKTLRTLLCVILTVCFCLSAIVPASAAGLFGGDSGAATGWDQLIRGLKDLKDRFIEKNPGTDETPAEPMTGTGEEFIRIFHLDCGRRYFSVDEIKKIINYLAENHYTHIELAFGNDGFRFLLDDMEVVLKDGTTYSSENVKTAIKAGNTAYSNGCEYSPLANELTQDEMNEIIAYANSKQIGIIPLIDIPGHSNALIDAMNNSLIGINVTSHTTGENIYKVAMRAFDVTNATAVEFVSTLVGKYIDYFAKNGSKFFNLGADECGYTEYNGFSYGKNEYTKLAAMLNSIGSVITSKNMTPMIFNDGFRETNGTDYLKEQVSKDFVICYWTENTYTKASVLATKFNIINTHNGWYYVVGNDNSSWAGFDTAIRNFGSIKCTSCDSGYTTGYGCMLAVWCDQPKNKPDLVENGRIHRLIKTLAENNPDYFKAPVAPTITTSKTTLTTGDTVELSISSGKAATWAVDNTNVLELSATSTAANETVTATAKAKGTALISATIDGGTALTLPITVNEAGEVTDNRTITVTVGGTSTDTINGANYKNGTWTVENESIATISVDGVDATEGSGEYSYAGMVYVSDLAGSYTQWTKTEYSHKVGTAYYPIYAYKKQSGNTYYYYSYSTDNGETFSKIGDREYTTSPYTWIYVYKETIASTPASTTVTFNGIAAGTTYVTVGHVRYTIKVTAEILTGKTIALQTWFTNCNIQTGSAYGNHQTTGAFGSGSWIQDTKAYYVEVKDSDVWGNEGKELSELLPDAEERSEYGGTYWVNNIWDGKTPKVMAVWNGRIHTSGNIQTIGGLDYSNIGTEFKYIRFLDGIFEVSANRKDWIEAKGTGSTTSSTNCKEQLAVYYMMRTEITKEVTTDVADWGYVSSEEKYAEQLQSGKYVMLDFAVKYQDGTRNPSTFPVEKTFLFHCNNGSSGVLGSGSYRQLNSFRAFDTSSDYEVYMVTVTMTEDAQSSTITDPESYKYNGQEKLIWAIDAETRANSELTDYTAITSGDTTYSFDETRCIGGDPYVRGVEVYNKHGALITYYVRAKQLPNQTITVHYIDKKTGDEFYNYNILVKNGVGFDPTFSWDGNNKKLVHNTVVNSDDFPQTINHELKEMLSVPAKYRRWHYECVEAKAIATDNWYKDAYIYYDFDNTVAFVMDFGLPMKFTPLQVNANLAGATISNATWTSTKYGDLTYDNKTKEITYTLHDTLDAVEKFTLYYTGSFQEKGDTVEYEVSIIPASNVYYEENFMKVVGVNQNWSETGTRPVVYQDTEVVGKEANVFGYDKGVQNNSNTLTHSMSNAYVATLELEAGKQAAHTKDTLQFTFTGTGFDLIAACAKNTGMLTVRVDGDKLPKSLIYYVDTYFHGDNTVLTNDNPIYQVPVVRNQELPYGTYTVTVRGTLWASSGAAVNAVETYALTRNNTKETLYRSLLDACGMEDIAVEDVEFIYMDENSILNGGMGIEGERAEISPIADTYSLNVANETAGVKRANVYVDAFRVYEPLGNTTYVSYMSKENGAVYQSLYDYVKGNLYEGEPDKAVLYVEYDTELNTAQIGSYQAKGPQNEIYLAPGCGIAFSLSSMNPDMILQISAKIVRGDPVLTVGTYSEFTLTSTELYYDITLENCISINGTQPYVVISNDGTGVLAISGLKIKGTSTTGSNAETQQAILKKFAKKSDTGFTPDVFTVSVPSTARVNRNFGFAIAASKDVSIVTIQMNGSNEVFELTPKNKKAVENGRASNYSYSKVYKVKESGTYTFTIKAYDVNGNSTEIVRTVTVQ